jgi:CHC2 zinc finger
MDDLRPRILSALLLRGATQKGRHYRIRCPFPDHQDANPSTDVDLEQGVFVCRSCNKGGGLFQLARLLGIPQQRPPSSPIPRPRKPWRVEAQDRLVQKMRWRWEKLAPWRDWGIVADLIRSEQALLDSWRREASALEDSEALWEKLEVIASRQADLEQLVQLLDAEIREAVADKRVPMSEHQIRPKRRTPDE